MEATELMISDWTEWRPQKGGFIGIVGGDRALTPQFEKIKPNHLNNSLNNYYPIPLTTEILEKNGFNEIGEGFELPSKYLAKSRFFIFKNKKALCIMIGGDWVILHYVHELQHALRLCGLNELAYSLKM